MELRIVKVDYKDEGQGADLLKMLNVYALDEQGGGQPLSEYTQKNLVAVLANTSTAITFLAYNGDEPIGIANCFEGFSTFAAKPLLNIHDFAVAADYRGIGVGLKLMTAVEEYAVSKGFCKLTLEVLKQNTVAQGLYRKFGFGGYNLGDNANDALFWDKKL